MIKRIRDRMSGALLVEVRPLRLMIRSRRCLHLKKDDFWESGVEIGLEGAKRVEVKQSLQDLQESCRTSIWKVVKTDAKALGLAEESLPGGGFADNPEGGEAQTGRCYTLEEELHEVCNEAEASDTKMKEL